MKYKKTMLITSAILVLGISAYLIFTLGNKGSVTIEEKPTDPKAGVDIPVIEIDEERTVSIEEEFPSSTPEYTVQHAIHGMSHQKVHAEDKWGFLPLTQVRVERLIMVVEENKDEYDESKLYLEILNRWANNDFSRADKDHNAIWTLQQGTVGRASGLLSIEEERAFIKKHFKIKK